MRGENGILLFTETTAFHKNGELCLRHQKPNAEMTWINTIDLMQTDTARYSEQPSRALLCSSYSYHIALLYCFSHTSQNRRDFFFLKTHEHSFLFSFSKNWKRWAPAAWHKCSGRELMCLRTVCILDYGSLVLGRSPELTKPAPRSFTQDTELCAGFPRIRNTALTVQFFKYVYVKHTGQSSTAKLKGHFRILLITNYFMVAAILALSVSNTECPIYCSRESLKNLYHIEGIYLPSFKEHLFSRIAFISQVCNKGLIFRLVTNRTVSVVIL